MKRIKADQNPFHWLDLFDFIRNIRACALKRFGAQACHPCAGFDFRFFVRPSPVRIFIKFSVVLPFAVTNLCYAPEREKSKW
jgi:hypothetical protein